MDQNATQAFWPFLSLPMPLSIKHFGVGVSDRRSLGLLLGGNHHAPGHLMASPVSLTTTSLHRCAGYFESSGQIRTRWSTHFAVLSSGRTRNLFAVATNR